MLAVLREHEVAVVEDVELARDTFLDCCGEAVRFQLGRETRGPTVVTASDRAISNLDAHSAESNEDHRSRGWTTVAAAIMLWRERGEDRFV